MKLIITSLALYYASVLSGYKEVLVDLNGTDLLMQFGIMAIGIVIAVTSLAFLIMKSDSYRTILVGQVFTNIKAISLCNLYLTAVAIVNCILVLVKTDLLYNDVYMHISIMGGMLISIYLVMCLASAYIESIKAKKQQGK